MKVTTEKFPASTPTKQKEATFLKLFKLLESAQNHLEKTDRIKSITIKDKDYTITIKPNGKA